MYHPRKSASATRLSPNSTPTPLGLLGLLCGVSQGSDHPSDEDNARHRKQEARSAEAVAFH
jgi:hypothetical protein